MRRRSRASRCTSPAHGATALGVVEGDRADDGRRAHHRVGGRPSRRVRRCISRTAVASEGLVQLKRTVHGADRARRAPTSEQLLHAPHAPASDVLHRRRRQRRHRRAHPRRPPATSRSSSRPTGAARRTTTSPTPSCSRGESDSAPAGTGAVRQLEASEPDRVPETARAAPSGTAWVGAVGRVTTWSRRATIDPDLPLTLSSADLAVYSQGGAGFAGLTTGAAQGRPRTAMGDFQDPSGERFRSPPSRARPITSSSTAFPDDGALHVLGATAQVPGRPDNDDFANARRSPAPPTPTRAPTSDASHQPSEPTSNASGSGLGVVEVGRARRRQGT